MGPETESYHGSSRFKFKFIRMRGSGPEKHRFSRAVYSVLWVFMRRARVLSGVLLWFHRSAKAGVKSPRAPGIYDSTVWGVS